MSVDRGERRVALFRASWLTYSVASWEVAPVPWEPLDEDGEEVPIYDGYEVCNYINKINLPTILVVQDSDDGNE